MEPAKKRTSKEKGTEEMASTKTEKGFTQEQLSKLNGVPEEKLQDAFKLYQTLNLANYEEIESLQIVLTVHGKKIKKDNERDPLLDAQEKLANDENVTMEMFLKENLEIPEEWKNTFPEGYLKAPAAVAFKKLYLLVWPEINSIYLEKGKFKPEIEWAKNYFRTLFEDEKVPYDKSNKNSGRTADDLSEELPGEDKKGNVFPGDKLRNYLLREVPNEGGSKVFEKIKEEINSPAKRKDLVANVMNFLVYYDKDSVVTDNGVRRGAKKFYSRGKKEELA